MQNSPEIMASLSALLESRLALDESLGVTHLSVAADIPDLQPPTGKPHPAQRKHKPIPPVIKEEPAQIAPLSNKQAQTDSSASATQSTHSAANSTNKVFTASEKKEIVQIQPQHIGAEVKLTAINPLCAKALKCRDCDLCQRREQVVFGEGNLDADLLFVGQAPGRDEDIHGRPFIGSDGEMLTDIIQKGMKITREKVYLTTIVKCRPPGNRLPTANEVNTCMSYLEREIEIVQPKIIIAVGLQAANFLTGQNLKDSQLCGAWQDFKDIPVMPIFDTSFLLRERRHLGRGNNYERQTWAAIQQVLRRLNNV